METRNKRILVTGGAGAIGTNLVCRLLDEQPERIVVLDNESSGSFRHMPKDERIVRMKADIRDDEKLESLFRAHTPEIVFHLAAQFANQNSVEHPVVDLETNTVGTLKLLKQCVQHNTERVLYTSSSCVYGHSDAVLDDDLPPIAFDTPYAISKGMAELYCSYFREHSKLSVVQARLFNCFGPYEFPGRYRNVIPNFIALALQGKPLPITGTGTERRTFTYVGDVVNVFCELIHNDSTVGGTYNVASTNDIEINRLAELINTLASNAAGVTYFPQREWDKTTVRLAKLDKLASVVRDMPSTTLEDGLKTTIAWAKQHPEDYVL
jgi:nucleoside-diphosphate-sugar epimerase